VLALRRQAGDHWGMNLDTRRRFIIAALSACCVGAARSAASPTFVMGTTRPEDSLVGLWLRQVYFEAFRRLAIPLRFEVHPVKRLGVLLSQGELDGEAVRGRDFGADLPEVVRVEESVWDSVFALYTANPSLVLKRLQDLPATGWRGAYPRGVVECERALAPLLSADRLIDVQITEQAVSMVGAGRADFVCGIDMVVLAAMPGPTEGKAPLRKLIDIGEPVPLHPFVNRKHAELAPRLAATLRQMKAEGLIERYRHEALRKFGKE
jgi:polar amino acid transport system substrate-binding protein